MALDRLNHYHSVRDENEVLTPPVVHIPGAVIWSQYDVDAPPPKPTDGKWTRFVCISDTHEHEFPVPPGDILIHGGDLTHTGTLIGARRAATWISSLPHPYKIVIAGNHDLTFHTDWYPNNWSRWHRKQEDHHAAKNLFTNENAIKANITYLEDAGCEVQATPDGKKWSFYGSPWQPEFYGWAFNYKRFLQAKKIVDRFPKTDILITHGPPHGILDETDGGTLAGCEELSGRLPKLRPRLHVFGHIHEGHGAVVREWTVGDRVERTIFVNAANWPQGKQMTQGQSFGRGVFMPVIVDLSEEEGA